MNRPILSLLSLLLLCISTTAKAETLVIRAAHRLDVETGRMVDNPVIVVERQTIQAIDPALAPTDATVVDLGDRTLLPGLMDAHVHLTLEDASFHDTVLRRNAAEVALLGAANARKTLMAGFTTVRDLGQVSPTLDLVAVALAEASEKGWIEAPHIIACGHALSITGGHIDPAMAAGSAEGVLDLGPEYGVADGIDEVVHATRYQIKYGAKVIKISATAGVMSLEANVGAQQYSDEEMQAIVDEAARHGIKVAAHAHGTEGINAAIRAGVASIEHGSLLDDESIQLMKQHGTYLVPTTALVDLIDLEGLPPVVRAKAEQILPLAIDSVERAVAAGVPIAIGTDAPLVPHGDNALELLAMVRRGMSPLETIQAATVNAADLFGTPDRGRIAVGMLADLIAVSGNPLEDLAVLQQVDFVVKAGTIYKQP